MAGCSEGGDASREVDQSPSIGNIREAKANIIGFMRGDNDSEAVIRDFMASTFTLFNSNINTEEDLPDDDGVEFSEDCTEISQLEIYKEKLQKSVDELLSSEEGHVWNLKQLMLYVRDEDPLSTTIPQQLFSNTRDIYILHSQNMYPSLKKAHYDLEALGNTFIQNEDNLKLYTKKYSRKSEGYYDVVNQHKYTFKLLKKELKGPEAFQFFLDNPFDRIDSYCLALDEIIKLYESMLACAPIKSICTEQLTLLDTLKDAYERLKNLISQIKFKESIVSIKKSVVDLMAQGALLREDYFIVIDDHKDHHKMRCFLFEKSLIFTLVNIKDTKQEYLFFDEINTAQLGFTAPRGKADPSFTVWYQKFNVKQYALVSNDAVREKWIETIQRILWQQMVEKKDEHLKRFSTYN